MSFFLILKGLNPDIINYIIDFSSDKKNYEWEDEGEDTTGIPRKTKNSQCENEQLKASVSDNDTENTTLLINGGHKNQSIYLASTIENINGNSIEINNVMNTQNEFFSHSINNNHMRDNVSVKKPCYLFKSELIDQQSCKVISSDNLEESKLSGIINQCQIIDYIFKDEIFQLSINSNMFVIHNLKSNTVYMNDCTKLMSSNDNQIECKSIHILSKSSNCIDHLVDFSSMSIFVVWNGTVFRMNNTDTVIEGVNLAQILLDTVSSYIRQFKYSYKSFRQHMVENVLSQIQGSFNFIMYCSSPINEFWFGKDSLGCHNFLLHRVRGYNDCIMFSSSTCNSMTQKFNVSNSGVFIVDFRSIDRRSPIDSVEKHDNNICTFMSWIDLRKNQKQRNIPRDILSSVETAALVLKGLLIQVLEDHINNLVMSNPTISEIALMFSGGLDSGILACLLLQLLPANIQLDLINIVYGSSILAPDRLTGLATYSRLLEIGHSNVRLICSNVTTDELFNHEEIIYNLICPNVTHMDFNIGSSFFFCGRGSGLLLRNDFNKNENSDWWRHISKYLLEYSYDLKKINPVPLDKAETLCQYCQYKRKPNCQQLACRFCCLKLCKQDLTLSCNIHKHNKPSRETVNVNVVQCLYENNIPKNKELNDEKSQFHRLALCDCCSSQKRLPLYKTTSKFLFSGNGADELFAGYSRYATTAKRDGNSTLKHELKNDLNHLWINLARDDRCLNYWGKQVIYPYLDSKIREFVTILPSEFLIENSINKIILREVAKSLDLLQCSFFKKRAIQFGTKATRVTNLKHFDSHRQARGDYKYTPLKLGN